MRSFWSLLLCCMVTVSTASLTYAVDPHRKLSQYAHTAWRVQDGYLGGEANQITQTGDGYIWIATVNGLFHFDGVQFTRWQPGAGEQLPSELINSIAPDHNIGLWIGTERGLFHWTGNELIAIEPKVRISSILVTPKDDVWVSIWSVGSSAPLCRVAERVLKCEAASPGSSTSLPVAEDSSGTVWTGNEEGVTSWRPDGRTIYKIQGLRKARDTIPVRVISVAPDQSLWVGTKRPSNRGEMSLRHLVGGVWTHLPALFNGFSKLTVSSLLFDRDGKLWIGTQEKGLYRVTAEGLDHFDATNGLSGDMVEDMFQDQEGDVWVATATGIDNFRDLPVSTFSKQQGLFVDNIESVIGSPDGKVWVGNQGSLDVIDRSGVSSIRAGHGLPGEQVNSMLVDHSGRLWLGIDDGLYIYDQGRFQRVPTLNHGPVGYVRSMAEDRDHTVWALTRRDHTDHTLRISGDRVREDRSGPNYPHDRHVTADPRGGVWFARAKEGLALYSNGHVTEYGTDHLDLGRSTLAVSPDGSLWAATRVGAVLMHGGSLLTVSTENGLPCNDVFSVLRDVHNSLWLYTACGLIEIPNSEIERWMANSRTRVSVRVFDAFDGVHPSENNFSPGATRSSDGRLWFATNSVLQTVDPDALALNKLPPPVHIEHVIAGEKTYSLSDKISLPPGTRDLQIDYTALSYVAPQKVRFQIRLSGHDQDWQDVGTRRSGFYTNLRPGSYQFFVRACNNSGLWNERGASVGFEIRPWWYETRAFRAVCSAIAVTLLYVLYLVRLRQREHAARIRFNERLDERTRIARALHDTLLQTILGSQIVADQARNTAGNPSKTQFLLNQLSDWLGRATGEGRAALASLQDTDEVDLIPAINRVIEDCRISYGSYIVLSTNGRFDRVLPSVQTEAFWIASEAIRNACKHSNGSQVKVSIACEAEFELRVSDNGHGIPEHILKDGKASHFGIRGMRERATRVGAQFTISSQAGNGTVVKMIVRQPFWGWNPKTPLWSKMFGGARLAHRRR